MGHIQLYFQNLLRANKNWTAGRSWPAGRSLDTPALDDQLRCDVTLDDQLRSDVIHEEQL